MLIKIKKAGRRKSMPRSEMPVTSLLKKLNLTALE
jgi:hypothetical protein